MIQAKACRVLHGIVSKCPYWGCDDFTFRLEETCEQIDQEDPISTWEWVHYAVNDFDNLVTHIESEDLLTYYQITDEVQLLFDTIKPDQL